VQQQWPRSHTHRQALSQGSSNKCASFQTAFDVHVVVVVAVGVADVAAAPTNVAGCADVAANAAAAAAVAAAGVAAAAAAACVERKKNTKPKNVARFASV